MVKESRALQGGALQGVILALLSTLGVAAALLLAPLLPRMMNEFSSDPYYEIKSILALVSPSLVVAITAPIIGRFVEAYGRKIVLLLSLSIYMLCGVIPFYLNDINLIIISRMGVGVAEAGIMTASTTLIGDYFTGKKREHWLVMQTGLAALSAVFFAMISGGIGEIGWRYVFWVYAMPVIYIPLVALFIQEPVRKLPSATDAKKEKSNFPWPSVTPIYLMGFPAAVFFFVIPIQSPFLLEERGINSTLWIGACSAAGGLFVTLGGFWFKKVSHWGLKKILSIAFVLFAIGVTLLSTQQNIALMVLGILVGSAGCGMTLPAIINALLENLDVSSRGRGAGIWQTTFFIGNFISPLVVMLLTSMMNKLSWSLLVIAILSLILSLFIYLSQSIVLYRKISTTVK